ncbi:MAG: ABC transporter permease [SAR324 cluster bacterium]|nr:ABC transporter permease [SAR324 cluster bacterium]
MTVFIVRRLMQSVLVVLVVSMILFAGIFAIGNPVDILLPPDATQEDREEAIQALGLDKPLLIQYGLFLANAVRGDLGTSFVHNVPSMQLILHRMNATLELALLALIFAVFIGIPLGMLSGAHPNTLLDRTLMTGSIFGFSIPNFWQGLMLIMVFSVFLRWLPSTGRGETGTILGIETSLATWDGIQHMIMPALNLSLYKISMVMRLTRASMRETLPMDFVKFARAKGLTGRRIIFVHVLKNIMLPIITVIGMELGSLIAFGVVTETIFAWPGMGKLLIDSINVLDRPVIVAWLMIVVLLFISINLLVDIIYSVLDPRIRLSDVKS